MKNLRLAQLNFFFQRRNRVAWFILLACLILMLLAWYGVRAQETRNAQVQFNLHVQDVIDSIEDRLRQHEQILLGGAGLFDASTTVDRNEWHAYVARLQLGKKYPGILGVGYSQIIQPKDLQSHVAAIRAEGFPRYQHRPTGERPLYSAIIFLEPFTGRNLAAFGYDMLSEETRAKAMRRAAETGDIAITGKVTLVQETHGKVQAGFLMYLPIYRKQHALKTPADRWQALQGFVYSPYRVEDLMQGIMGASAPAVSFTIFDGMGEKNETRMYDSTQAESELNHLPLLSTVRKVRAYGHTWTVRLNSRPAFEASFQSSLTVPILILGVSTSLLLFALVSFLIARRGKAEELAQQMTSDIRRNEVALRESAQHTQTILDNMVDGIITIDQTGSIASLNPAAERIFGYKPEEVLGHNVKMLMPIAHRDAHDGYLRNYHTTGIARIIGIGREVEGQHKDGSLFPMELAISEITREGRPMYVGMVRDITERKRVERMKSEFVSTVSHELRTPLTSISGALGLVSGGALGEVTPQAREMIGIAYKNCQRLTYLINDLLDMEKITSGKLHFDMHAYALMPMVEQALQANRDYGTERNVTLNLVQTVSNIEVRVDNQRLMQVLANLLSNAIKFSPKDEVVEIAVEHKAPYVRVSVRDHGPGIPEAFRDRIFQKFAQADSSDTRQKGGTGLGLAITRELVERMGGQIGFESKDGEGACFFFDLPVWHAASVGSESIVLPNAPRILVVEDEPDVARLLGLLLGRSGYAVDIVASGTAALEALQNQVYDAMTLDLMLPDMSGIEIIRQLREQQNTLDLPIIVVSAKVEAGQLALSGDFYGVDWLAKPIDETRLLGVVDQLLEGVNQLHPRVLHVEDDVDLHRVIRAMVGGRFDFELATTLYEARIRIALERFDVVILDLNLPDGSGWDLLTEIRTIQAEARVVILTGSDISPEEMNRVESILFKTQISPRQLLAAINTRIQSDTNKGNAS